MPPQAPSLETVDEINHIPAVESPYANTRLTIGQHVSISAYWFATNFMWGALLLLMLPDEVKMMNPEYRAEALGLLTGLSALVALFVPLITGAISDRSANRWGRRRPFMAVGVGVNVIGLAVMAFAVTTTKPAHGFSGVWSSILGSPGFLTFGLGYLIVQLGNNIASAAFMGVIPDVVPHDQHGIASGYMALMSQLGTLLGAVACGLILASAPESTKYLILGAVLVGVACITLFGLKEKPLPYRPKIHWGKYIKSLWIDPRQYPDFAWVWITRALVMLGFYSVVPFINYYLVDVINVPQAKVPEKAVMIQVVILVASTVTGFLGGKWSDKVGRKKVVYIANSAIAVMALSFIFCRSLNDVLLAGFFFGLGYGAYISVDYALGTDVLPSRKDAAKEMAVWHIAMTLPQSIAAPFAGYLISIPGKTFIPPAVKGGDPIIHYTTAGYSYVFILCATCFALGAYLLRNVRGVK